MSVSICPSGAANGVSRAVRTPVSVVMVGFGYLSGSVGRERAGAGSAGHPGQPAVGTAVSGVACCRSVASKLCTSWAAFRPVCTAVSV